MPFIDALRQTHTQQPTGELNPAAHTAFELSYPDTGIQWHGGSPHQSGETSSEAVVTLEEHATGTVGSEFGQAVVRLAQSPGDIEPGSPDRQHDEANNGSGEGVFLEPDTEHTVTPRQHETIDINEGRAGKIAQARSKIAAATHTAKQSIHDHAQKRANRASKPRLDLSTMSTADLEKHSENIRTNLKNIKTGKVIIRDGFSERKVARSIEALEEIRDQLSRRSANIEGESTPSLNNKQRAKAKEQAITKLKQEFEPIVRKSNKSLLEGTKLTGEIGNDAKIAADRTAKLAKHTAVRGAKTAAKLAKKGAIHGKRAARAGLKHGYRAMEHVSDTFTVGVAAEGTLPRIKLPKTTREDPGLPLGPKQYLEQIQDLSDRKKYLTFKKQALSDDIYNNGNTAQKEIEFASADQELAAIRTSMWDTLRKQPRGKDSVRHTGKSPEALNREYSIRERQIWLARKMLSENKDPTRRVELKKRLNGYEREIVGLRNTIGEVNSNPDAPKGMPIDQSPRGFLRREGFGSNERRADRIIGAGTMYKVRKFRSRNSTLAKRSS